MFNDNQVLLRLPLNCSVVLKAIRARITLAKAMQKVKGGLETLKAADKKIFKTTLLREHFFNRLTFSPASED